MKKYIHKFILKIWNWLGAYGEINVHRDGFAEILTAKTDIKGTLDVGAGSKLYVKEGAKINSSIFLGKNSHLTISKDVIIDRVNFYIGDNSNVILDENVHLFCGLDHTPNICVENGELAIGKNSHIQSEINVRFGGKLKIGSYTSINYNSEIRCEEYMHIGDHCLISYDVCIFDTNTHSKDPVKRKERVIDNAREIEKSDTLPVKIGNLVWIGKGATILKGTEIGDNSIVGIRTIVTKNNYPKNSVIVSNKPVVFIN
jgi:acetyltransferase-like isoleucine patch superfamily enzyme